MADFTPHSALRTPHLKTTQATESSAAICRRQGWGVGTILVSDSLAKAIVERRHYVEITAVGVAVVVVQGMVPEGPGHFVIDGDEHLLNLKTRDWTPVRVGESLNAWISDELAQGLAAGLARR